MKRKHFLLLFCLLFILLITTGCTAYDSSKIKSESYYGDFAVDGYGKSDIPDIVSSENNVSQILAGQITSAAWSDIKNYNFWNNLFMSSQDNKDSLFTEFFTTLNTYNSSLNTRNMITVKVSNSDSIITNQIVKVENQDFSFTSRTNNAGLAYLFLPIDATYPITLKCDDYTSEIKSYPTEIININLEKINTTSKILDLMLVIDTTGSMSDELDYLKAELKDVIEKLNIDSAQIRLGLLFYRDLSDEYITKMFDFTTNISSQINNISSQFANGGGDFPEAVDTALDEAVNKANWSDQSTKLLIHVLDAPPHTEKTKLDLFCNSIINAAKKGIRIVPVASSGIDKWTEYLLRTEAIITGGIYTYITNDSGIGNNHIEATVGDVTIEFLNNMLIRIINEYYTGIATNPIPYNQK